MSNSNPFMDMFSNMCSNNNNNMGNMMGNFMNMMNQNKMQSMFDMDTMGRKQKQMMENMNNFNNSMTSSVQAMVKHSSEMLQDNMSMFFNAMKECVSGNADMSKQNKMSREMLKQNLKNAEQGAEIMFETCLESMKMAGEQMCDAMCMEGSHSNAKKKNNQ